MIKLPVYLEIVGLALGAPALPPAPPPPGAPYVLPEPVPVVVRSKPLADRGRVRAGVAVTLRGEVLVAAPPPRYFEVEAARLVVTDARSGDPVVEVAAVVALPFLSAVLPDGLPAGVYDALFILDSASAAQQPGAAIRLMVQP